MDKRIGAQLYTVRDLIKTEEEFISVMKKLSDIGYKSIQFSGVGAIASPERLREICDGFGLKIACTHKGYNDYKDKIDEMIAFHKALDCDIAGLGSLPVAFRKSSLEEVDEAIDALNRASEKLEENGMVLGYHNHAFEFAKLENGQTLFSRLLEKGRFTFILDLYWLAFAGLNPAKFLEQLGDRVSVIHYKDMKVKLDNTVTYTEVGAGTLNFDEIVKASGKARWAMVEQDLCEDFDPVTSLENSYNYITEKYDFI